MNFIKEHLAITFLDMLTVKKFEDISITELVNQAGIGRATFYRKYLNKEDILIQYFTELLFVWQKESGVDLHSDFSKSMIHHFYDHKTEYLLLYKTNLSHIVYEVLRSFCKVNEQQNNIVAYTASTFAGSLFGWTDEWMRRGMTETPEELILLSSKAK